MAEIQNENFAVLLTMPIDDNSESLEHWGLRGMKWGRRRYRNYDGTLTPEGKARYYTRYGRPLDQYTTEELRNAINRLNTEREYIDLWERDQRADEFRGQEFRERRRKELDRRMETLSNVAKGSAAAISLLAMFKLLKEAPDKLVKSGGK